MAARAYTTPVVCPTTYVNDNDRVPDRWPDVIRLMTSFGDRWGIAAWRARLSGQTPLGFIEDVLEADRRWREDN